jgi:endogenous inhibitor of DNA gyrase (YacG/DUF329 family)
MNAANEDKPRQTSACPECGKQLNFLCYKEIPYFPFCSRRCKFLDLARWFREEYAIERGDSALEDEAQDGQN